MRNLKIAGLALGICLAIAVSANAAGRFRGHIVVVPAYRTWGWYDPFFYGSYWPYSIYEPYSLSAPEYSNAGVIELKTNMKDADVYINGAYAGKAGKLKSIRLRSDTYTLELRVPGREPFEQRIYVLPGKTIRVQADFSTAPRS